VAAEPVAAQPVEEQAPEKLQEHGTEDEKPAEAQPDALELAKAEAARMRDQMLRIAADFDNFRKRSRREIDDATRRAREDVLRELLPVFDNLERAVVHADQSADVKSVADGVRMVLRQFQDTTGKMGINRVKTVGETFDPNVHEAIQQLATGEQPPGTVVAEVQAGYTWAERLVRAAMVVVAKAPEPPPSEQAPGSG
jgi:molecular chaperone GrpE